MLQKKKKKKEEEEKNWDFNVNNVVIAKSTTNSKYLICYLSKVMRPLLLVLKLRMEVTIKNRCLLV